MSLGQESKYVAGGSTSHFLNNHFFSKYKDDAIRKIKSELTCLLEKNSFLSYLGASWTNSYHVFSENCPSSL